MYTARNGHTIETQREYEQAQRKRKTTYPPNASVTAARRAIEARREQAELDALVNYLN
ncbi:hypothetical protein [Vibrio furnissii]|uniref:hypothetical protein n=1 Tax=Vibrio furnissii TaxID=29494 RepID=UPI001EE9CD17|nr:hypothetical protein [Vibrio furnissii]MCG6268292.1 hypothetical protein [Vibrio furnissii]